MLKENFLAPHTSSLPKDRTKETESEWAEVALSRQGHLEPRDPEIQRRREKDPGTGAEYLVSKPSWHIVRWSLGTIQRNSNFPGSAWSLRQGWGSAWRGFHDPGGRPLPSAVLTQSGCRRRRAAGVAHRRPAGVALGWQGSRAAP